MTGRLKIIERCNSAPATYQGEHYVFIVGSPRSGTTITAETLARHPEIVYFYEPYYLWKHGTGTGIDDELAPEAIDDRTLSFIRRHCHYFWQRSGSRFVVEQSPEESLMVPLLQHILPKARFIHMVRNGYDCIRSIAVEWEKRKELVQSRNPGAIVDKAVASLARQPLWRFRMLQLAFELRESGVLRPWRWANKSKWNGKPGWGVRIPGWETVLNNDGSLVLNAMQWNYTVTSVLAALEDQPPTTQLQQRYEELVTEPGPTLEKLQAWIGVAPEPGLASRIHAGSVGKGRAAGRDQAIVTPLIASLMTRLGYEIFE